MKKYMILVIDGCAPEYLTQETAPNIFALARKHGFFKTVSGVVPTVTNVNHACILSGCFPEETKVVGNYFYNAETKEEGFIEERGFMKAPTILQRCREKGLTTALLTVKGKILGVYGDGADIKISVQTPDPAAIEHFGLDMPPAVSSVDATRWILNAALACISEENPEFLYCTTNDYAFHHFAPGTDPAREQIRWIDHYIAEIHRIDPEREIYITADHGMNQKHRLLNVQAIAGRHGIHLFALAPLKDRYIENHVYQEGGILYLFLDNSDDAQRLIALADTIPEIKMILPKEEAARQYHLPETSIGDYVIFAAEDCAFGEIEGEYLDTSESRTHGSLFEQTVPLVAIHPAMPEDYYKYSKDIVCGIMERGI